MPWFRLAAMLVLIAAIGLPLLIGGDPNAQDLLRALEGPSLAHPFGFDHLGRDVLLRILHGAPRSIGYAGLCVLGSYGLGLAWGMAAAYRGGWFDSAIMRLADLLLAFPGLLLALLLAGFAGGGAGPVMLGIGLGLWPQFVRLARSVAQQTLTEPHVEAAELAGFPAHAILRRHVLPPLLHATLPIGVLSIGGAILSVSSLGFLGLGVRPPEPEWGAMISEMMPYISEAPLQMSAPCIAIFLSVLIFGQMLFRTEGRADAV